MALNDPADPGQGCVFLIPRRRFGARAVYGWKLAAAIRPLRPLDSLEMIVTLRRIAPFTAVDVPRLRDLWRLGRRVEEERIPGALVQCGVWRGGSAAVAARASRTRDVWLFDSFEGFPAPGERDADGAVIQRGDRLAAPSDVIEAMRRVRAEARAHVVRGWFDDTLPTVADRIGPIALLSLDADLYDSTRTALRHLYDLVVSGGFVVVDDYGFWPGCRRAVDEFLDQRGERVRMHRSDATGVWFQKS